QRELHATWVASRRNVPERRAGLLAGRVELRGGVNGVELRMVERVVHFHAELEVTFLGNREVLEDGNVLVVETGQSELGDVAIVADIEASGRPREHRCIEPLREAALAAIQYRAAGLIEGSAGFAATREVKAIGGAGGDVGGQPDRESADPRHLPVVQNLFGN